MKKILLLLSILLILTTVTVFAADAPQVTVDGKPIQTYIIAGKPCIALEDLENYGFTLYYNNNVRSLFITKTGAPAPDFQPKAESAIEITGSKTDIRAFVNGVEVNWSFVYALDGKLAATVETLGDSGLQSNMRHKHHMIYQYDAAQNTYNLITDLAALYGSGDGVKQYAIDMQYWTPMEARYLFAQDALDPYAKDTLVVVKKYGGLPPTSKWRTMTEHTVCLENGLLYNADSIIRLYYINPTEAALSVDGRYLYFVNTDLEGNRLDGKKMDLYTMHIEPTTFEMHAEVAYKSSYHVDDFTFTLNGVEYPLTRRGGELGVKLSLLLPDLYPKQDPPMLTYAYARPIALLSEMGRYLAQKEPGNFSYTFDFANKTITAEYK